MKLKVAAVVSVILGGAIGDYALSGSASATPSVTVTTLTSSPDPSVTGQPVTLTATVSESPVGGTPTGLVTFEIPGVNDPCSGNSNTEPLSAGVAQCSTVDFAANAGGTATATAQYDGDANNATSSNSLVQTVGPASTSVALTSTAVVPPVTIAGCQLNATVDVTCPSLTGVAVGAAITDSGSLVPGGTTVVTENKTTHTLTMSAPATGSATESLTFQNNPQQFYASGHSARFTATVSTVSPATGTPSGRVSFTITPSGGGSSIACSNGTSIKVGALGTATCIVVAGQLVSGGSPYSVTANFLGDASYDPSSQTMTQRIAPVSTKTFLAGNPMPPLNSTPVHFTASVVPSQATSVPTGSVSFTFTSQPFTANQCDIGGASPSGVVTGCGLSDVQVGDVVTDLTSPSSIPTSPPTTVVSVSPVTLSVTFSPQLTDQNLRFTPTSSPTITCDGGTDTITLTSAGATCTLSGGLPSRGSPFGVTAAYSGDANNLPSSSRVLSVKVH